MTNQNAEALRLTHTGGIVDVWSVPRVMVPAIILRLMTCKSHLGSHVFVVDQSGLDPVNIGISQVATLCIADILDPRTCDLEVLWP